MRTVEQAAEESRALVKRIEELLAVEAAGERSVTGATQLLRVKAYTLGYILSVLEQACMLSPEVEGYVRDCVANLEATAAVRAVMRGRSTT